MWVSSIYICPVRGLAGLEAAEPTVLLRALSVARVLGLERVVMPVLEEALLQPKRPRWRFLDGLLRCLDQCDDARMPVWLMAPAQRILGVDWVAPYLVRGHIDDTAAPVFVDGAMRPLKPYPWWADPSILRRRLLCFREVAAAMSGHPALMGWIVMDRGLEWPRPDLPTAELILKSYCAEIRERDAGAGIHLSIGPGELLDPVPVRRLAGEVDGLFLRGMDGHPEGWMRPQGLTEEVSLAAYLGTMARWLFEKPVALELGMAVGKGGIREETLVWAPLPARQQAEGIVWVNLMDPQGQLLSQPPWCLETSLAEAGLLDRRGEPKEGVDVWVAQMRSGEKQAGVTDFIDMGREEYADDPRTHLTRLWDHFREAVGLT